MWIFYALLAPFLFAVVHILDSYCVDEIFERPWIGIFTSSAASIIVFIPIPFIAPFIHWNTISLNVVLIAIIAGILLQISQGLYFQALSYSRADIIGSYWNIIPIFIPILSFIIYEEVLNFLQYTGITLLVTSSTFMLLLDHNISFRRKSFLLMFFAAFIQSIVYLLLDSVYSSADYFEIFCLFTFGIIITGFTLLFPRKLRKEVLRNMRKNSFTFRFFVVIEITNLIALAAAQRAIQLGNPSLVAAIETTLPFFVLVNTAILISIGYKRKHDLEILSNNILKKIAAVAVMFIGVLLVSIT